MVCSFPIRAQESPEEIFSRSVDQMLTNQMELSMRIETTDNRGRITEKEYDILMARFGETDMMRMIMQQPERAKGITIIVAQQPDEEGIIEVFTPSNGKVRKMKASPENLERVGSSFVLAEYGSSALEDMDFTTAGTGELEGDPCYIVEAREKENPSGRQVRFMIEQTSYYIRQIQVMDETGVEVSRTKLSDFQPVPGLRDKVYPIHIQTENFEEQTVNKIELLQMSHRPDLKEEDFKLEPVSAE
jgi:outer membrane lipoprotein-sorting protein